MMLGLVLLVSCAVAGISADCSDGYTEVETKICTREGLDNATGSSPQSTNYASCPAGFLLSLNPRMCFIISPPTDRKDFAAATQRCERMRNGRLVVLNAEDKYGYVAGIISVIGPTGKALGSVDDGLWVGLKRASLTLFRWSTGSPYVSNWGVGQPEKVIGENCGQVYPGGIRNRLCNLPRRYICELAI
ncbi:uncharacterized protein LOC124141744 [Haliotis rufescens]|uniref:uncharacterized protein LOC124141744 n=1 Tax=Haliotis rufescens TaxID=6454 RepID=UPI00201F7A8C|nr:uncharacterized protein LOC124141744 [Haliotis rufescens]